MSQLVGSVPSELEEQANFFDAWKSGTIQVEGASRGRGVTLDVPAQIPEAHLDGLYWTNDGRKISV
jgi:hypothetical protein